MFSFIDMHAFENAVCEMAANMFRPKCVNYFKTVCILSVAISMACCFCVSLCPQWTISTHVIILDMFVLHKISSLKRNAFVQYQTFSLYAQRHGNFSDLFNCKAKVDLYFRCVDTINSLCLFRRQFGCLWLRRVIYVLAIKCNSTFAEYRLFRTKYPVICNANTQ